jgi:hypothetical protein
MQGTGINLSRYMVAVRALFAGRLVYMRQLYIEVLEDSTMSVLFSSGLL